MQLKKNNLKVIRNEKQAEDMFKMEQENAN